MNPAELTTWLVDRVAALLGRPASEVDTRRPLREAGLSSRDTVALTGDLRRLLGRALPTTLLWEHSTIADLVGALSAEQRQAVRPMARGEQGEPIAVVGVGVRLPGGVESPADFWRLLDGGRDAINSVPDGRWEAFADPAALATIPGRGGFIADATGFDAAFFGITPREAEAMDPQQRVLLEVAWSALEHAGIPPSTLSGTRTGVFTGISASEYGLLTMSDLDTIDAWSGTGAAMSIASNRLSYLLDLRGPSLTVDTACSSSLVAAHMAVQSLQCGESETALVAGVNLMLSPGITANFHRAGVLAEDGRCKPFAGDADGIVRGEGCGVVVLRRLSEARRAGDRVLAVIRGSAVNSDGRSNGLMAPNPRAQEMVLADAYAAAGVDPAGVDYVEAHGTGTPLGDPIEAAALGAVLGSDREWGRPLLIGSVKSNLGHLEGAAGIVGLIKVVLSLGHRRLPASLHFDTPNAQIDFDGLGLRVVGEPARWPRYSGMARAGVSAFGFGGTNAHVVLEEWPAGAFPAKRTGDGPGVFAISDRTNEGVRARAADLARWLDSSDEVSLGALASTLAGRREHLPIRAAVLADDRARLVEGLRSLAKGVPSNAVVTGEAASMPPEPVFVFSGYGSQWRGMGRELLATEPVFREAIDALEPVFLSEAGFSLRGALEGEPDGLAGIQLALLGTQLALATLWRSHGVEPAAVIGHSMGEVAASVVAGALEVADGIRVMATRSRLLESMDSTGAMAVVELSPAELSEVDSAYPGITVAVYASPTQCTVSGDADQVAALVAHVESLGRLAKPLKVAGAGHSSAVDSLLGRFRAEVGPLSPRIPEIACYTSVLDDAREEPDFDVEYWAANLRRPVRFTQALDAAMADGHALFLEISPHPVALAAIDQTAAGRAARTIGLGSASRTAGERATFLTSLARLHVLGVPGVLESRTPGAPPIELPGPRWRHQRFWPARRAGQSGAHPLLGTHVELPEEGRHVWRGEVGTEAHPWLADHAALGVPVFPGTGFLELALAAARTALRSDSVVVAELELLKLLPLSARTEVTTTFSAEHGRVEVHAKSATGEWTRHATAKVRVGQEWAEALAGAEDGDPFDLYRALDAIGQSYGPAFRGLREVTAAPGRATASISLPGEAQAHSAYVLHPALADACLHALAAAADLDQAEGIYLPLSLGSVSLHGDPGHGVRVQAVVESVEGDGLVGSVRLLDASGAVVVSIGEVYVRRFQRASLPVPLSGKVFEARWEQAELPAEEPGERTWLVLGDLAEPELAAFRDAVSGRGDNLLVRRDTEGLAGFLRAKSEVDGVLWMLGPGGMDPEAGERLVLAAGAVVAELAELPDPPRLWLVGSGGAVIEPGEAGCPGIAALRGLVRVLAFEHPEIQASLLDFDAEPDPARLWVTELHDEIRADSPADEVAWREGVRYVRRLARPTLNPGEPAVREGAYVITGGLGGLGLHAARWLLDRGADRVVLSSRRGAGAAPLPGVEVVAGDIAEVGVAERLVEAATRGGMPLRGVLHAAGVLADGAAMKLTGEQVRQAWWPKAHGAWRLNEATAGHDLDWWLVYSSAASLLGSPGQAAYATANAWMDALVDWRRANGLPATTINWGAWGDIGAAAGTKNPVLEPLSPDEGLEALEAVLADGRAATGVARLDTTTVLTLFPQLTARAFFAMLAPDEAEPDVRWDGMAALRLAEPSVARAALADHLVAIIAGLMGFEPEQIDRHCPLTQLGLDSLLAMRARGAVERDFGLSLPMPLLLRGASLSEVAAHLAEAAGFGGGPVEAVPVSTVVGPRDPAERWVARVWREVLAGREPGVYEDFFLVGGDAERAERLRAAIAEELSAVPDEQTLFAAPTIAAMADLLRAEIEGHGGGPVRLLRDGVATDPVFLFHPAGGPTSVYRELADRLTDGQPAYGFERLDDLEDLEDKAACYAELVREIQPSGPYRLGGWSFGGCLAYETAHQLAEAGEQVDLVFLIDSILPLPAPGRSSEELLLERFGRFAEHIEQTYGAELDLSDLDLGGLDERTQIRRVMERLAAKVPGLGQGVLHHQYTSYLDARVAERYHPRPYAGRVVLFRAQEPHPLTTSLDPRYLRTDDALGWDELCSGLEVVRVPGDHLSLIDPPNVEVISDRLNRLLNGGSAAWNTPTAATTRPPTA
ncbi:beta-ketoacyl synthase N-terminal-like domain-containing protein [Amycolatopsis magusensis]|uniref:beta-ketoacyl synthase N-terminal-like domain-containing protein n=1 Tax=Amycolatopsis magusensis TaxID=882444 RepID=UPI003F686959